MGKWFTTERIDGDTFVISEYRHYEHTHLYLLLGTRQAALIDTGLGVENVQDVVQALTALPVMVLTTHVHWDHIGGHGLFERLGVHEAEGDWLDGHFPLPLAVVRKNLMSQPCAFPETFQPEAYQIFQGPPQFTYRDGTTFDLGGRQLMAVHTPGHSPGHCCFYEPERGYLYAGDLVYRGCLYAFYPTTDPVQYSVSLDRVRTLSVKRLFPGHHSLEVTPELIPRTSDAFHALDRTGKLFQGAGIFNFGDFQIQI